MPELGELKLKITGDSKDLARALERSIDMLTKVERKGRSSSSSLRNSFRSVSRSAGMLRAVLVGSVAAIGVSLLRAASNAEETRNKFNVTFRSIGEDAQRAARQLQQSYGMSIRQSEALLSGTGDLLTGFGFTQQAALGLSSQVQRLAVDLASFTNLEGGTSRASEILTKAMLGERDALVSLGVKISEDDLKRRAQAQGIRLVNGQLDNQTRAQLTLAMVTEQSRNAVGDFARSQDSFANQSRILSARLDDLKVAIGQELLPVANDFVKVLINVIGQVTNADSEFRKWDRSVRETTQTIMGVYAVENTFNGIRNAIDNLTPVMQNLANFGVGVLNDTFNQMREDFQPLLTAFNNLKGYVSDVATSFINFVSEIDEAIGISDEFRETFSPIVDLLQDIYDTATDAAGAIRNLFSVSGQTPPDLPAPPTERTDRTNRRNRGTRTTTRTTPPPTVAGGGDNGQSRLATLREQLATETELENERFAQQLEANKTFFEQRLIDEEEFRGNMERIEEGHQSRMSQIRQNGMNAIQRFTAMSWHMQTATAVGELASLMQNVQANNKKMFYVQKAGAIAMAVINTYQGVSKSLSSYPWPLAGVMAAAHLVAGLATVMRIKNTSYGGGGGGGGSLPTSGGGAAASAATSDTVEKSRMQDIKITLNMEDDALYSGSQVRKIMERIGNELANGEAFGSFQVVRA